MKQLLIIKLLVWLGWLSCIALAQLELGDALTGSVSFPSVGVTCIGNLAAFFTSFLRRRLDLEMGARDFMATITGPELEKIPSEKKTAEERKGLTTITDWEYEVPSVVMLSTDTSNSSINQFMKYMQNAHYVHSILLPCKPSKPSKEPALCASQSSSIDPKDHECRCIEGPRVLLDGIPDRCMDGTLIDRPESVPSASETPSINVERHDGIESSNVQTFKEKLDWNTQGILIPLTGSRWLLPCIDCLKNGCHGGPPKNDFPAVCHVLESELIQEKPICICIPVKSASEDDWTRALIRSFKSKDQEDRGATVKVSDALQSYLDGSRLYKQEEVSYRTALIIVPRLVEIVINLLLTVWFKVDGFSSALVARRAIRNHVVDSKGIGLPASAFLTHAQVNVEPSADKSSADKSSAGESSADKSSADKSSADKSKDHKDCPYKSPADKSSADECSADESSAHKSSVCQVLTFRGTRSTIRTLSSIVGGVNLICSVYWAVFIAFDGGARKWYEIHSILPSKPMVAVVIAAICFGLLMDSWDFWNLKSKWTNKLKLFAMIVLEILFAVVVAGGLGLNKGIGRWVYSALQVLVWVKWGIGSYLLGVYSPDYDSISSEHKLVDDSKWVDDGTLVYSSAFLLNAALAGVRANWAEVRPNN